MKVRKLAVALALAGGLGSGVAQALGLGEIELQSYLNEPLDAEIILPQSRGVDPGDVFVNIAPESAYERVGLNRNQFLSKLRFKVVTESNGSLTVNVSSKEPLREPYLNFLLELTWPNGRLMREYAVLVDPPVYSEESGIQESVRAPSASSSPASQRSFPDNGVSSRQPQVQSRGYQAGTFGPTGPSDTLWEIAAQIRPGTNVSMQQVMLAIQDLNPDAFMDGNINRMKRGEVLRMPSIDQMQSRTRAEAIRVASQQNDEFQATKRAVDATDTKAKQGAVSQAEGSGDQLKLLVADNETRDSADGGSAGGDGQLPGGVDAGTAIVAEELASSRRENAELNSRVEDLQDQLQTLQRLLELKNNQLTDLQKVVGETSSEQATVNDGKAIAGVSESDAGPLKSEEGDVGATPDTNGIADEVTVDADTGAQEITAEQSDKPNELAMEENATGVTANAEQGVGESAETGASDSDSQGQVTSGIDQSAINEPGKTDIAAAKATESKATSSTPDPVAADKSFLGTVIDAISNNPVYQFALGGGLVLLLLILLVLARRNANREKAFYEQLNSDTDENTDSFDLNLDDDDESELAASEDVLAEVDAYVAYGRHDQATQALETAISREPSRTDLRLKLLSVYADVQDRDSFEKQVGEIEALGDEEALAAANELRLQLEEAESMPSMDDLESELRSDSFSTQLESEQSAEAETDISDFESDLAGFDLSESDESLPQREGDSKEDRDDLIDYDLSGISLGSDDDESSFNEISEADLESGLEEDDVLPESDPKPEIDLADSLESDSDDADFSLELDEGELDEESTEYLIEGLSEDLSEDFLGDFSEESAEDDSDVGIDSLDESFLDELDAELDKVANEDDESTGEESDDSSLNDLELDVSDEDLALMEEFSESAEPIDSELEEPSLDDELDLNDALSETDDSDVGESLEDLDDLDSGLDELPVASDEVPEEAPARGISDIDESDLGDDDDDFDFLAGTDEAATKLDLARAYIEMGDSDGARDILEEVALEGSEEQKAEAQDLLKNMS